MIRVLKLLVGQSDMLPLSLYNVIQYITVLVGHVMCCLYFDSAWRDCFVKVPEND